MENLKAVLLTFLIFLILYSCNNKKKIIENQISNRSLVQAYVDTVLNNILVTDGVRGNKLLPDSFYIKSIKSSIFFASNFSSHPKNYKLIIDNSSKNIYNIPKSWPHFSLFINEELQLRLLEQNIFFQSSFQEDLTFADLELFLNDNSTFRNKFPEREILDSIFSIGKGYSFGKRIHFETQIDSFFDDWLNGAKVRVKNYTLGDDPNLSKKVEKFERFIQKVKPLLKEKLRSKFVLLYACDGIKYLEINPYNNYERNIFWDKLNQKTRVKDGEIDSANYRKHFEREFFSSAFGKQSLYKLTAFTIGYNL